MSTTDGGRDSAKVQHSMAGIGVLTPLRSPSERWGEEWMSFFAHEVKAPAYVDQVVTTGVKSTFRGGALYRHPGLPPMLDVSGDHLEMGVQYGVLLRDEILEKVNSTAHTVRWMAHQTGVPVSDLLAGFDLRAGRLAARLPDRFREEAKGVAEGSGVSVRLVLLGALSYDILEGKHCTGVLMRTRDGGIIHGRSNDTSGYGGEEIAKGTVVVRHRATGYNAVTHIDHPLFLGVETGYNDRGLTFSEETLKVREPNPDGFSLPYLIRIALEECSSLDQLGPLFDSHPVVGAYGCVWSDRKAGRGLVTELTPTAWAPIPMTGSLLSNFNRIYDPVLQKQQHPRRNIAGLNHDREILAAAFPRKAAYDLDDAVAFMRLQVAPDGADYAWCGTRFPICNWMGSQMMIFHPGNDGLYLALGPSYAARRAIYHIHDDFARQPERVVEAAPLAPVVEEAARIENSLTTEAGKMDAFGVLSRRYESDANVHFLVARHAFLASRPDAFAEPAARAYALKPSVPEFRLYAGMAASWRQDKKKATALLRGIAPADLNPEQQAFRLHMLEQASAGTNPGRSAEYATQKQALLGRHGAEAYFEEQLLPLLRLLTGGWQAR